jgi:Uncharacterized protein conserved in bacteria
MAIIYHITTRPEWEAARASGLYTAPSLQEEGFIHCSQEGQVAGVLQRYFAGKNDLVKLSIDTEKLSSQLVYEWSPTVADTFPHVYGPVNVNAVVVVENI